MTHQKEDIELLKTKAKQGDADSQYRLGLCYVEGTGVRKNLRAAFRWLIKAAKQEHGNALKEVAKLYPTIDAMNTVRKGFYDYKKLDNGTYRAVATEEYREALGKNVVLENDEGERWEPGMPVVAPLKEFNGKHVTSYRFMFYDCKAKSLDLSLFDTSNVNDMGFMFFACELLENVNLSRFDTSRVTQMIGMFEMCESLVELDLSHFNTERVRTLNGMFYLCHSLKKTNLSSFNTRRVKDMCDMFSDCPLEVLDISSFTITDKTLVENMLNFYSDTVTVFAKDESVVKLLIKECERSCEEYKLRHPDAESTDYGKIHFKVKDEAMLS